MGANCCVAAKDKPHHQTNRFEASAHRNIRHSPSWSFRWDNRTHIEDIMDNVPNFSHHNHGTPVSEIKSGTTTETEVMSERSSPSNACPSQPCLKPSTKSTTSRRSKTSVQGLNEMDIGHFSVGKMLTDQSVGGDSSLEDKGSAKSAKLYNPDTKPSTLVPLSPSSPSSFKGDPSSSRSNLLQYESISSRKACRSPGYQLARQISKSRIPSLKSLNESSSPEERQSVVLSIGSADLSTRGSHDGSSDGWSMQTFSELVASSQRERWLLESENLSSNSSKMARVSSLHPSSPSPGLEACRICSVHTDESSVVAVLVCGHFYHADCLENLTHETERYDPPCPICTHGEKSAAKLFGKVESRAKNKISKIVVADRTDNNCASLVGHKRDGKAPKIGTSSSMKNSFSKPFLRRHFSIGRPSRSMSENESTKKRSFWERHRRE